MGQEQGQMACFWWIHLIEEKMHHWIRERNKSITTKCVLEPTPHLKNRWNSYIITNYYHFVKVWLAGLRSLSLMDRSFKTFKMAAHKTGVI